MRLTDGGEDRLEIIQGLGPTPSPIMIAKYQVKWNFSCKPKPVDKYDDSYHKMSQYAIKISGPAVAIEPAMTAQTFKPRQPDPDDSVFLYEDTASSRAEIVAINDKLKPLRVGIVGLGGTGSYVLDFVAKTPVKEIHRLRRRHLRPTQRISRATICPAFQATGILPDPEPAHNSHTCAVEISFFEGFERHVID